MSQDLLPNPTYPTYPTFALKEQQRNDIADIGDPWQLNSTA
jgi:hypothetical protein